MLKKLRTLFAQPESDLPDDEAALHLAAAALLVEIARSDHALDGIELERMRDVLARDWGVEDEDLDDLLTVAKSASETSVSLHEQIDLINRSFSPDRKVALVRGLWEIACADGRIHHHEEALIRRLADLLYVSHTDFIRTKHQVLGTD